MIQGSPLSRVNKMLSKQNRTPSPRVGKYEEGGTVGKYGGQMYGLGDWISENKNILADQYVTNVLANLSEEQWKKQAKLDTMGTMLSGIPIAGPLMQKVHSDISGQAGWGADSSKIQSPLLRGQKAAIDLAEGIKTHKEDTQEMIDDTWLLRSGTDLIELLPMLLKLI